MPSVRTRRIGFAPSKPLALVAIRSTGSTFHSVQSKAGILSLSGASDSRSRIVN